jgi:hypothetical protein
LGGFIAKPVVGVLDGFSHATASAARLGTDDIDPELADAVSDSRYSLDGYLRLAWYHHCKKLLPPSAAALRAGFAASSDDGAGALNRAASRNSLFGRSGAATAAGAAPPAAAADVALSAHARTLRRLSEQLLLTSKLNYNSTALLCSNVRLTVVPLPAEYAGEVPAQLIEHQVLFLLMLQYQRLMVPTSSQFLCCFVCRKERASAPL